MFFFASRPFYLMLFVLFSFSSKHVLCSFRVFVNFVVFVVCCFLPVKTISPTFFTYRISVRYITLFCSL